MQPRFHHAISVAAFCTLAVLAASYPEDAFTPRPIDVLRTQTPRIDFPPFHKFWNDKKHVGAREDLAPGYTCTSLDGPECPSIMARQAAVERAGPALPQICQPMPSAEEPVASLLLLLNTSQFNECVSRGLWAVFFSTAVCGHCKTAHEQLREYAQGSYGKPSNLHVGLVDCSSSPKVCSQEGIKEMPALRLYVNSLPRHLYMAQFEYPAPKPTGTVYRKTPEGGITEATNAMWTAGAYGQWVSTELESLRVLETPRQD